MDAFELLKADHRKVAGLFDQLEAATGREKLGVFNQIRAELELHTHIEEKIFYPALEKPEETHDLTLEAYEEHDVVKRLLAELSGARNADDEWEAKAKVLRENVEHHVEEEENELFDKADEALGDEQIEALGQQMEAEKARQQGRGGQARKGSTKKSAGKSGTKKRGLVGRIADFVGLGSNSTSKKSGEKGGAKKSASKTTKKAAKKSGGTKSGGSKGGGTKRGGTKKAAGKKSSKSSASKSRKGSKKSGAKKTRRSSR